MSFFPKIKGTIETLFAIGKLGPQIKNSSPAVAVRNSADSDYAPLQSLMATQSQNIPNGVSVVLPSNTVSLFATNFTTSGDLTLNLGAVMIGVC